MGQTLMGRQGSSCKAIGSSDRLLLQMIFIQAGISSLSGTGIGVGLCAIVGELIAVLDYPFRMMWFTPLFGALGVSIVSLTATGFSVCPVLKLEPGVMYAHR